jgi:hypothetical protein
LVIDIRQLRSSDVNSDQYEAALTAAASIVESGAPLEGDPTRQDEAELHVSLKPATGPTADYRNEIEVKDAGYLVEEPQQRQGSERGDSELDPQRSDRSAESVPC